MKKLFLMIAMVSGISAASMAQTETQSPEQRAKHQVKMLQKQLNLSADQTTKINSIIAVRAQRMDSLKNNLSIVDKRLNRLSKRSITLNTDAQIAAVLTPDQQKTYEAIKAERKEKAMVRKKTPAPVKTDG